MTVEFSIFFSFDFNLFIFFRGEIFFQPSNDEIYSRERNDNYDPDQYINIIFI